MPKDDKSGKSRKSQSKRSPQKKAAKQSDPAQTPKSLPGSPVQKGKEVNIPKSEELEEKKEDKDKDSAAALYAELQRELSGMWVPDRHASESIEPILLLQGVPFFKRKAVVAQGLPSHVIDFSKDSVTVSSIKGSEINKVHAPLLGEETPLTPRSIVAISEEDEAKEDVKAYFADPPKSLLAVCPSPLLGKCLKVEHRYLNGDRKVEYHAVQVDQSEQVEESKEGPRKVKKFTTTHFHNRALGKEAKATLVSNKDEPAEKLQKPSKPQEDGIQSLHSAGPGQSAESSILPPMSEVSAKANATAESVKTGLGYVGAATVGAVIATDTAVTPKVTAWLLPPLKKTEVQAIEAQEKHKAPEKKMLKLTSSTTGLDDIASWLTPSMQRPKATSNFETSSVYSQQSRVSESYLVNPFSSAPGSEQRSNLNSARKSARSKADYAASKKKTGMMMEARAMSLLFPFSADESPRSVKENDEVYTFRDDDEEFNRVQSHSFQLLDQFKSKKG